ncbi:glucose 1-dehydrogenase [Mangrovimicrobium sediminis]|uniref:Glucose 1-dehydrogenase n=1 Tax=Mangrovimicrobium sediminis TaxID=2562682 RepID=A0A4Z0LVH7_9GAMM|nr:glucose 1-dehydrogenase [Haliea sp. SAOS-164]TGD71279.1 glucose 1-dehydrogenase [Haliea sp. SAOS-164]
MQGLLHGKVAVITGAGSGVGRAAALLFAGHGAKVVAADINLEGVEAVAAEVVANGGEAVGVHCDVTDAASVDAAVAKAVEAFGRLDVMYNNAGITTKAGQGFLETGDADLATLTAVNVGGVIHGCQSAIRQFDAQGGGGAIVMTASVAGLVGFGGVVYGSSKGAVTSLTRTLALEVARKGIRVNSVCPAGMPTNFGGGILKASDAARQHTASHHPLGRVIEPEECAAAALFLASDLASNITGVNLPVDGGLAAGKPIV